MFLKNEEIKRNNKIKKYKKYITMTMLQEKT